MPTAARSTPATTPRFSTSWSHIPSTRHSSGCVLNPGDETVATTVGPLLAEAHDFAARKSANRAARTGG
ncbi:hypothetical protein ACFQV8_38835 [Pseudonocardia benzenivorans]